MLELELEVPERLRGFGERAERQVPYAVSLAMNRTAEEAQEAQRVAMRREYTIRRPWVLQGIKIPRGGFASKQNLSVTIGVDPARDFLTKFERGGKKRPRRGGRSIAVPEGAKRNKQDIVPKSQRPRSFEFTRGSSSLATRVTVMRGNRGTMMIRYPDGRGFIFQRVRRRGKTKARRVNHLDGRAMDIASRTRRDPDLRLLFLLTPEVTVANSLGFTPRMRRVFTERFPVNFSGMFDFALRTAK